MRTLVKPLGLFRGERLSRLEECDAQVEKALAAVVIPERAEPEDPAPKNPKAKEQPQPKKKRFHHRKTGTGLKRDLSVELQRLCGVDLTQVMGLNVLGVLIILSEIGLDIKPKNSVCKSLKTHWLHRCYTWKILFLEKSDKI